LVDAAGVVIGEMCHLRAQSVGGPRYDPGQSDTERHGYGNLILLCPLHHQIVDSDVAAYSVDRLLAMKEAHEGAVPTAREPSDAVVAQFLAPVHASSGATVVISHNQSGGVTAGTVNINAAPEPTLETKEVFANQPAGSEYHSRVELRVQSPYPPANLYVAVHAPSLLRMHLSPQRSGMVMMGHCGVQEGRAFQNLQQPNGVILLDIATSRPETFRVDWDIQ